MLVFVTGASGYLGEWVVKILGERGHEVVGVNSKWQVVTGNYERYSIPTVPNRVIANAADVIVHLGWRARAGDGEMSEQLRSLEWTVELLNQVSSRKRIVFASTAAVYGDTGDSLVDERRVPRPTCEYGRRKLEAERLVQLRNRPSLVLRLGSLMGRGVTKTKTDVCVNAFAAGGYSESKSIEVWDPESWKPVIHVQDAARAIAYGVEHPEWRSIVNIAYGSYRALELAGIAREVTGGRIVEVPSQRGSRSCRLDCSRLRSVMPEMEFTSVEEAIREMRPTIPPST